jgi:hypothetical protein
VAASVIWLSAISTRMPVRVGSVSSRPAAIATWATAEARAAPGMVPLEPGMSGSDG